MAIRTMRGVSNIVMAYGSDPRNTILADPHNDDSQPITPPLSSLSQADFTKFFKDFTTYIRRDKGMSGIIMTSNGLKACPDWASLCLYVFGLQR